MIATFERTTAERPPEGISVITGGGTGIGAGLALELSGRGHDVLIVGRRREPLERIRDESPREIRICSADVTEPEGRRAVVAAVSDGGGSVAHLVHNAAVLDPVGPLAKTSASEWEAHFAVNLHAPLFLTQALLEHIPRGGRILNISSGAAHRAVRGWGAYCTSKAALYMLSRCLREELEPQGIRVGSVRPGVVDTPMQEEIRGTSEEDFPSVQRFRELKASGELESVEEVGRFLVWLLLEVEGPRFSDQEWDIRDDWDGGGDD